MHIGYHIRGIWQRLLSGDWTASWKDHVQQMELSINKLKEKGIK